VLYTNEAFSPKTDIGIYLFGKSRDSVKKDSFLSHIAILKSFFLYFLEKGCTFLGIMFNYMHGTQFIRTDLGEQLVIRVRGCDKMCPDTT